MLQYSFQAGNEWEGMNRGGGERKRSIFGVMAYSHIQFMSFIKGVLFIRMRHEIISESDKMPESNSKSPLLNVQSTVLSISLVFSSHVYLPPHRRQSPHIHVVNYVTNVQLVTPCGN